MDFSCGHLSKCYITGTSTLAEYLLPALTMIPIYLIFLIKIARSHYKFNFHYCYVNFYFSILPSICAQFATINVKKFFAIRNCFIVRFRKYIRWRKLDQISYQKPSAWLGKQGFPPHLRFV